MHGGGNRLLDETTCMYDGGPGRDSWLRHPLACRAVSVSREDLVGDRPQKVSGVYKYLL